MRPALPRGWSGCVRHDRLTPGGALQEAEEPAAAALRELREETGLRVDLDRLGGPVATTAGPFRWNGREHYAEDVFYLVTTPRFEPDTAGFTEDERRVVHTHRWWSPAELERTEEVVFPVGLATLIRSIVADGRPVVPVRLLWGAS